MATSEGENPVAERKQTSEEGTGVTTQTTNGPAGAPPASAQFSVPDGFILLAADDLAQLQGRLATAERIVGRYTIMAESPI